jgi:RNA-directed DNA polymerase
MIPRLKNSVPKIPKSPQLEFLGLPVINDLDDFSATTHFSKRLIWQCYRYSHAHYRQVSIPKKSGGSRLLFQPSKSMKALQSWILRNILDNLCSSPSSKGFEIGTSILSNALPHCGCNIVAIFDIADFFPSIQAGRVYRVFNSIGYSPKISGILTAICTHKGVLPQGGPCSPKLSNLICWRLDKRLNGFLGKKGIVYTRYADDLTFSSQAPKRLLTSISTIKRIIVDEGFTINEKKTRISGPARQKKVTGLIIHEKNVGIERKRMKRIRSEIFSLCKISNHKDHIKLAYRVNGLLAFVKNVDQPRYLKLEKYISELSEKFPGTMIELLSINNPSL